MEALLEQFIHTVIRWVPDPILSMLILLLSFVLGLLIHRIVFRILISALSVSASWECIWEMAALHNKRFPPDEKISIMPSADA